MGYDGYVWVSTAHRQLLVLIDAKGGKNTNLARQALTRLATAQRVIYCCQSNPDEHTHLPGEHDDAV
jgi:hypothetical protein